MIVSPVRFTFLSDEVLGRYDTLHYFARILVKVVANIKQFSPVCIILTIFNIDSLKPGPGDLMQASDWLGGHHIDFIEGFKGPG